MKIFNLVSVLGRSKEKETLSLLRKHMNVVYNSVSRLGEAFVALKERDANELGKRREEICLLEHEADGLRRDIEERLFSGAFLPSSRGRILDLIEEIDEIADAAQDVANLTGFIEDISIGNDLQDLLKRQLDTTLECVALLKDSIGDIDHDTVWGIINDIRKKEHEVDEIEDKAFHILYTGEYDAKSTILLSKLIEFIGGISNNAEDASDTLSLIVLMHKP